MTLVGGAFSVYRGRLAPTPSGHFHLGHARTFWTAAERARAANGRLVLRVEDLDPQRSRPEFVEDMYEDFEWMGIQWDEGPFFQQQRRDYYLNAWQRLKTGGFIYPCDKSRKDVAAATSAPHPEDEEAERIFPPEWRASSGAAEGVDEPAGVNWRFRVPDAEVLSFEDAQHGPVQYQAGKDFGDFVVWRRDDVPAYELAVVVDDIEMAITEVVRGDDLLKSTARQLLLYRALSATPPAFCHLPLVRDASGRRLAKRHDDLSLKRLREQGATFKDSLAGLVDERNT